MYHGVYRVKAPSGGWRTALFLVILPTIALVSFILADRLYPL